MTIDAGLAQLSDRLLVVAVVCYSVALLGYAAELAFGRTAAAPPPRIAGGASDLVPTTWTAAPPLPVERAGGSAVLLGRCAVVLTGLGWVAHAGWAVARGLAADRVPWGNMFEFSGVVCLVAVTAWLLVLTRQPVRHLGVVVMLPVVLYLGLAGTVLYAEAAPLMPALNSYWIKIHVVAAASASGVFMLASAVTVVYLAKDAWERRHPEAVAVAATGVWSRLPSAAALDRLAYRANAFAFPIWTFAVLAGAIWAEAAWGRPWGWDPKETWSLITWVCYAGYLHARVTAGWRGRRAAVLGLVSFTALMFCYYGVNLWISGLHSYAGV